jgi:hypothetical protein
MSPKSPARDEYTFWRKLILPEEDRKTPWEGKGYRWFRSPNVIPIEQWHRERKNKKQEQIQSLE